MRRFITNVRAERSGDKPTDRKIKKQAKAIINSLRRKKLAKATLNDMIKNIHHYLDPTDANYGYVYHRSAFDRGYDLRICRFCKIAHDPEHYWNYQPLSMAEAKKCIYWKLAVASLRDVDVLSAHPQTEQLQIDFQPGVSRELAERICDGLVFWVDYTRLSDLLLPFASLKFHLQLERIPSGISTSSIEDRLGNIKSWIHKCNQSHMEGCSRWRNAKLPDRVLDVQPDGGGPDVRLTEAYGMHSPYVTLSHCWGEEQPLKTEKHTLEQRLDRIAFESLPTSFQHVVTVARALGIRYVWIDSLCIIQDQTKDWHTQSRQMGSIYANSYVTVVAASAPNCNAGFLKPKQWVHEVSTIANGGQPLVAYATANSHEEHTTGPLFRRGWFFQEWLLSERVVWFEEWETGWSCAKTTSCECGDFGSNLGSISRDDWDERLTTRGAFLNLRVLNKDAWYDLVSIYAQKDLTYRADGLPAFTAIAERFRGFIGDTYLAGLWKEDLVAGLSWHAKSRRSVPSSDTDAFWSTAIPSWSWASALPHDLTYRKPYADCHAAFYKFHPWQVTQCVEILDVHYIPSSTNEFGPGYGEIILRGKVALVHLLEENKVSPALWNGALVSPLSPSVMGGDHYRFFPDCYLAPRKWNFSSLSESSLNVVTVQRTTDADTGIVGGVVVLLMHLCDRVWISDADRNLRFTLRYFLVLAPSPESTHDAGVYQRVGFFMICCDKDQLTWEYIFGHNREETVTLV